MRYILFAFTFIVVGSSALEQPSNFSTLQDNKDNHGHKVLETPTDSTKPIEQMSATEKMDAHVVHFTGALMSDTFVLSHFTRAFVADIYSDFLRPGKYSNGTTSLPKSIASSLDGIAIPQKTRLVVYNKTNCTGTILMDVTGPAIVNNSIWESSEFYSVANKKNYCHGLQEIFPQKVRRWDTGSSNGMSYWQNFSFEIQVVK